MAFYAQSTKIIITFDINTEANINKGHHVIFDVHIRDGCRGDCENRVVGDNSLALPPNTIFNDHQPIQADGTHT